jgi:hypothetical protein
MHNGEPRRVHVGVDVHVHAPPRERLVAHERACEEPA